MSKEASAEYILARLKEMLEFETEYLQLMLAGETNAARRRLYEYELLILELQDRTNKL